MLFRPMIALAAGLAALLTPPALREAGHSAEASAEPGTFAGIYDFYLGGIWGGEFAIDARLGDGRYRAEAAGKTTGIVSYVWNAGFAATTDGALAAPGYVPERYAADAYTARRSQKVEVRYADGAPREVAAEPPFEPKPWAIEPAAQTGTSDPLSAMLAGLALQRGEALCDRRIEVFDGRRRYVIELGAPMADQGMMRCAALYRRIAGFKPEQMERPDWPLDLWFAAGPDGLWHLDRAMGEMKFGIATLNLRAG